jgi:hypothetical protein
LTVWSIASLIAMTKTRTALANCRIGSRGFVSLVFRAGWRSGVPGDRPEMIRVQRGH